jgi:hypothetical protein
MLPARRKQPTPETVQFGQPPTLTAHLCRGQCLLQQFERFIRLAEIGFSACQDGQHVGSVETADSRKERKTLFHQSDALREFAAIRGRGKNSYGSSQKTIADLSTASMPPPPTRQSTARRRAN